MSDPHIDVLAHSERWQDEPPKYGPVRYGRRWATARMAEAAQGNFRRIPDSPGWQAASVHHHKCWCQQCKAERDFVRSGILR